MNPYQNHPATAHFGPTSASNSSAGSSNVDSMSPYSYPAGSQSTPIQNPHFGYTSSDPSTHLLPSYFVDRRNSSAQAYLERGVDGGDPILGLMANDYNFSLPSRPASDDMSHSTPLPPPPRTSMSSGQIDALPLGTRAWIPQGRAPWQDSSNGDGFDWGELSGSGASSSALPMGAPDRSTPEAGRQSVMSHRAPPSESSPLSVDNATLHRTYSHLAGDCDYPKSAAYPGNLYADLAGDFAGPGMSRDASGVDCGQALAIYEYLLSSLPQLRPNPSESNTSQTLQPLIELASDGLTLFSAQQQQHHSVGNPEAQRSQLPTAPSSKRGAKEKAHTKCLGCGATETPEWRRGPMGPRTLCNACGLVHMKLQRKKRKMDEKLAAAERGEEVVKPVKVKKVKKDEEAT